ncbi:MAG: acyl-CoA dehydrogenase family protein, partial [Polyangiaceae bacterium]
MDFALTAEQVELKRSARRFLEERSGSKQVRAAAESERGWDAAAWASACELGWPALAGVGWVELAVVAEEAGRTLACLPLLSSVFLGANALRAAGYDGDWMRRVEAGEVTAALVAGEGITARTDEAASFVLSGVAPLVVDGHSADLLLVVARLAREARGAVGASEPADAEPSLFLVDASAPGVTRRREPTLDVTRTLANVILRDVNVPAAARIGDARAVRVALD